MCVSMCRLRIGDFEDLYFSRLIFRKAKKAKRSKGYAEIPSKLLATIEQYRISFKRNTMVVKGQFIRIRHL